MYRDLERCCGSGGGERSLVKLMGSALGSIRRDTECDRHCNHMLRQIGNHLVVEFLVCPTLWLADMRERVKGSY